MTAVVTGRAAENVYLTGVPDYEWHAGCFGTATGNLMGFWDRHGFAAFYTGPTGGGVAPLDSFGRNADIRAMWASERGVDGRPANRPGHMDDYYVDYESVAADPYVTAGRVEHEPDCLGDFIGLNQNKWSDLGGECSGNIDGYSFNYFESGGLRRDNFDPPTSTAGRPIPDIQSGLRAWTRWRGAAADTFSQLSEFNPGLPAGRGFRFEDLKAEIDAGYPVLLFMQAFDEKSRTIHGRPGVNPSIHGMLAYGYVIDDDGNGYVRYRTSWASGDRQFSAWNGDSWTPNGSLNLPLRGVIGYHPRPQILEISRQGGGVRVRWQGPLAVLRDEATESEQAVHAYVVEQASTLEPPDWREVAGPVSALTVDVPDCCDGTVFFRLRLMP